MTSDPLTVFVCHPVTLSRATIVPWHLMTCHCPHNWATTAQVCGHHPPRAGDCHLQLAISVRHGPGPRASLPVRADTSNKKCVCKVPDRPSSRAEWVLVAGCLVVSVVSVPGGRLRGSSGLTPALLADTGARNQSTSHRPRAPSQGKCGVETVRVSIDIHCLNIERSDILDYSLE